MENDFKNMMDELRLVKYLSGELDEVEAKEIEQWLEIPENKLEFDRISQLWENTPNLKDAELFSADKNWTAMKQRMDSLHKKTSKERNMHFIRYAVAASLVIVLGLAVFFTFNSQNRKLVQYTAANVKQDKPVILPDGTKVYLNRNTNLTYDKSFNDKTRTISLTGEAYFDVAPNSAKPFIIKTASAEIKVVGTSFNVMAYSNSDSVSVAVESGIVEMYSKADKESKLRLTKGTEGTYLKSDKKLTIANSFDSNSLAWKTNQLNFKNADITYVIASLEHAFGKEIKINSNNFRNCRLNANFNNQSLDVIFNVIEETLGIKVKNNGDVYIISGSGCK